jgi:amidohydrolase
MIGTQELRRTVTALLPDIVEIRHALHRIPETHFEERETSAMLRGLLAADGFELLPPLLGTDVVGLLRGGAPGPCILLRADIDGLPIEERAGTAWASCRPGRAHSCGHDGHMAILIGALRVLRGLASGLAGSVRFVFQPAEEEMRGGRELIERGLLDLEPRPGIAYALHGWPGMPLGRLGTMPGAMMAAADTFTITIRGKGGHAAYPHLAADSVLAAAQIVAGFQSIISRSIDPLSPAVLSVTRIEGGSASNVIPDRVVLEGTTRFFDPALQAMLSQRMERIASGICIASGCTLDMAYKPGYIPLVNDAAAVERARRVVTERLGGEAWMDPPRTMGAEDFAFFLEKVPGALLRLGLGEGQAALHTAAFDFNDEALEPGITALVGLVLDFCV